MDINVYHNPDRPAKIKPLSPKREWMKDTGAYHCPPMIMGNTFGWYMEIDESVTINWNGSPIPGSIKITLTESGETVPDGIAVDNFGNGIVTFPIPRRPMFETPEDYSLLVYGPPNMWIDGLHPLTGIVETDWSASPFTMNWKITKINQDIVIPPNFPIVCFIPINIKNMESFKINFKDIESWERLDELKIFQANRPANPYFEQEKLRSDATHNLYSKGIDLKNNKVKDRKKKIDLFNPET